MLPVTRTKRATADVYEIALYLFDQGAHAAAAKFSDAVDATAEFISRFPDLGEDVSPPNRPRLVVRAFAAQGFPSYLICFRRTVDRIIIVRVIHGSRQVELFPEFS
jgi:plasmid stabilization system protein ParE